MVADRVLDTEEEVQPGAVLTHKEIHPLALEGYKRLISAHSTQTPVVLKSWGTPEVVYAQIRQKLIDFNYSIEMAEDMAQKLVDHAINHAEDSRNKYAANIIALKIEVSKREPPTQFETGALEVQRIDGINTQAQVAGATSTSMTIDTSGTQTTAVRDAVGEIIQAMGGTSNAVWLTFEAPNKSELDDLANDMAMGTIAQIGAGALAPEQIQELLTQLQTLAEAGHLSPEIMAAIQNLQQLQVQAAGQNLEGIKELSQAIMEDLSAALEGSPENIEMISAIMETLQTIASQHGLEAVIDVKGLSQLQQDIQVVQLTEQLEAVAATLEGADKETLDALIEELGELDGNDLLSHLESIQEHLTSLDIPAADLAVINTSIEGLKEIIPQNFSLDQKIEMLANIGAQDLMDVLQTLDSLDELPPELSELIEQLNEKLDIENMTLDDLKDALTGQSDPAITEAIQQIVATLQNPEVQAALPQSALNEVNQFLAAQPDLVEAVTAANIISELSNALSEIDPASPEAATIQDVIERLESGDSLEKIDAADLQVVAEKLDGPAATSVEAVVQTIQNTTIENVTIGADTKAALVELVQSGDLDTATAEKLEQAIDNGDLATITEMVTSGQIEGPAVIKVLEATQPVSNNATMVVTADAKAEIMTMIKDAGVSAEVAQKIEQAIENGDMQAVAEIIQTENINPAVATKLIEVAQQIPTNTVMISSEAKAEIMSLVENADITPEVAQQIEQAIENGDMQAVAEIIQTENISPAVTDKIIEVVQQTPNDTVTISAEAKAEIMNVIDNADIPANVAQKLEQAIENGDMQAVAEIIQTENISPTVTDKIIEVVQQKPSDTVTISAEAKAEVMDIIDNADIPPEVAQKIEQAIENGDISALTEIIATEPSASETVSSVLNSLVDAQQNASITPAAQAEVNQIIADISSNPDIATNTEVVAALSQAIDKSDFSAASVADIKSSVGLASYGGNPVSPPQNFSPPAVSQQLAQIATVKPAANTPPPPPATAQNLQAVAEVVGKLDSPKAPPTIKEVVTAVQKLNEVKNLPPAQQAQVEAVKEKLVQSLPEPVRQEQKPALAKTHTEATVTSNTPVVVLTQEGQKVELTKNDMDDLTEKFKSACDGNCAGCTGCAPKEDFKTATTHNNSGQQQLTASNQNSAPENDSSPVSLVVDNTTASSVSINPFSADNGATTQWVISDATNDNVVVLNESDMADLTEKFKNACDGNCGACGKCAIEVPKNIPEPRVA